jgi:CRISPR-associated protein Csm5
MKLEIEVLTPVHIGDGARLLLNLDFMWHEGEIWVLNMDRLFESLPSRTSGGELDLSRCPLEIVRNSRAYVYSLPERPAEILSFIKTLGKPFIPGSSLKGAMRTALGQFLFPKDINLLALPRDRRRAARPIEEKVFGRTPHEDRFKEVKVLDAPFEGDLKVAKVGVYEAKNRTLRRTLTIFIEVIPPGSRLWSEIKAPDIKGLYLSLKEKAKTLIEGEIEFFTRNPRVRDFYEDLLKELQRLGPSETLLQIGWGTGWRAKTFDTALKEKLEVFERLRRRYNLGREGHDFPITRKLVEGERLLPLGWVKLHAH